MRRNVSFWAISMMLSVPPQAYAGAWTVPQGMQELYLTTNYYATDRYFDREGERRAIPRFTKWELNPYLQYGWTDDFTLGANLFLQHISQDSSREDTAHNYGLGNSELFVRYRLYHDTHWVASVQPLIALPTLYEKSAPDAGRDDWDAELQGLLGYQFTAFGLLHYFDGGFGYRYRNGDEDDQWRGSLTAGISLTPSWMLIPQISWVQSVSSSERGGVSVAGANDYDLSKVQLSAAYRWDERYTIQFGGFTHLDGENTGGGGGALLSLWIRY